MNELLQRHGCSNVFTIPEGLKELMADISREVLRDQPCNIFDYIANYLSVLLITREHGILSVKIMDDLCDCRPSVSEHLVELGMDQDNSKILAQIIKEEIEGFEPEEGKEKVKEIQILKKILARSTLDESMAAQVCQVARNAYRDYWYRKKLMEKKLKVHPHEAWEVAAERTLALYKKTKPSFSELTRATQQIQAAYRGYYVRRNLLSHLKPKKAKRPKMDIPGPPLDIADSREIDLGPVINVRVREEDTTAEFDKEVGKSLNLDYDPMRTITHVKGADDEPISFQLGSRSGAISAKSVSGSEKSITGLTKSVIGPEKSIVGPSKLEMRKSFKATDQPDPMEDEPYKLPAAEGASKADLRKSQIPEPKPSSQIAGTGSRVSVEQQMNKISFAQTPQESTVDGEVPEEVPAPAPQEDAPEVPEDLMPGTDGGDSAPEAYDSAAEADDSAAEADDSAAEADDSAAEADDSYPFASEPESTPATDGDEAAPTEDEEE